MRDIKALWFANNICETGCSVTTFGYARVSTQDQDLSGQIEALKAAGATTIYREKISGVRADRPQLAKLTAQMGPGDIVVVTKLVKLTRFCGHRNICVQGVHDGEDETTLHS